MSADITVQLPNRWAPRRYQWDAWNALDTGIRRILQLWHRRAGKDTVSIHGCARQCIKRIGVYWHVLPTLRQGRRIIWEGKTKEGRPFLDAFPEPLIARKRNDEMSLLLKNPQDPSQPGSLYQVVGSDNVDALVGANPIGVIMSEYALQDPAAWDLIRPILAENDGWAMFPYTPRGHNHGYRLFEMAKRNPNWFCQKLTVDDTHAISQEAIEEERASGMSEAMIEQEFYCSFDAPIEGAYYATQMIKADKEGRITTVPHEPQLPVETWWDLGIGDAMAIWFVQRHGPQIRCIRYYENTGFGLDHYINHMWKLRDEQGYLFGQHYAPHDIEVRELGTGKSRKEVARELGVDFTTAPKLPVDDGINAVRSALSQFWFDEENCSRGIDALRSYQKEEDEAHSDGVVKFYRDRPLHNWASHGADAARTGITGHRAPLSKVPIKYKDSGVPA